MFVQIKMAVAKAKKQG